MDVRETANQYYDAWRLRAGDMNDVPLAEDLAFTGRVASFDTADGFRAMARQAGAGVRSFTVRHPAHRNGYPNGGPGGLSVAPRFGW